jgi:hypothetical protein
MTKVAQKYWLEPEELGILLHLGSGGASDRESLLRLGVDINEYAGALRGLSLYVNRQFKSDGFHLELNRIGTVAYEMALHELHQMTSAAMPNSKQ